MKKRKIISLTLTEYCNLDCVYCYEGQKSKEAMSVETAKKAISDTFENSDGYEEIEFDFFGGEPTIQKKAIVELVEWSLSQEFSKPFCFFLETNGTLIHGSFQNWLIENKKHVHVGLSLDGKPETHNKNRNDSYDKIDIDFFVKSYPYKGARMTVYSETVGSLFDDIMHLHSLGFSKVDAFFAFGIDWSGRKTKSKLARELRKLCDYYLENPDISENRIFDINLSKLINNKSVKKWCGSGEDILSIAVDGKTYPCHMFQPNSVDQPLEFDEIDFTQVPSFNDSSCFECMLEPICPNCYGMNYYATGDVLKRERSLCDVTKIRTLAVSYLRAKQIENGISKMSPSEIYQTIEAINMVQRNFSAV